MHRSYSFDNRSNKRFASNKRQRRDDAKPPVLLHPHVRELKGAGPAGQITLPGFTISGIAAAHPVTKITL